MPLPTDRPAACALPLPNAPTSPSAPSATARAAARPRAAARALATTVVLALTLSGCALPPVAEPAPPPVAEPPAPPPPPPPPPPDPALLAQAAADVAARQLLEVHTRIAGLDDAALTREAARLETVRAEDDGDAAASQRLALALLLVQRNQGGDLARAAGLLDALARPSAPAATRGLAQLLLGRVAEQRRLTEQLDRQAQLQRELQRRIDTLGAQLEALKAIERSLGRPAGAGAPAPPAPPQAPK